MPTSYTLTACTSDAAQLIVSQTRTTCPVIRDVIAAHIRALGLVVIVSEEP